MQVLNHIRTRTEHSPDRKGASPSAWVGFPARSEGARGGVPVSDGEGFIDSICVNMHQHACLMLRALHHGRLRKAPSQHAHSTPCAWPSSTPPAGQGMCAGEWGSWSRAITSSYHHLAGPSSRWLDLSVGKPHLAPWGRFPRRLPGHGKTTLFSLARKASRKVNRLPECLLENTVLGFWEKGRRTRLPFSPSLEYCVRPYRS